MVQAVGNIFMLNNRIYRVSEAHKLFPDIQHSVYEVIRIMKGVPLFFEDHFQRLQYSLKLKSENLTCSNLDVQSMFHTIIEGNNINEGNVRLDISTEGNGFETVLYQLPAKYPSALEYENGVTLVSMRAERSNPEIKQTQLNLRKKIDVAIKKSGAYEIALVTTDDLVTEGSRSNIFFVKNHQLFTAPASMVLEGITAKYVKNICNEKEISVIHSNIKIMELNTYEACFITGTSPKILPVHGIDHYRFNVKHGLMKMLMDAYDKKIHEYIHSKKKV